MKKAYLKLLSGTFVAVLLALSPANGEEENLLLNPSFENLGPEHEDEPQQFRDLLDWFYYGTPEPDPYDPHGGDQRPGYIAARHSRPQSSSHGIVHVLVRRYVLPDLETYAVGYYQDISVETTEVGKTAYLSFDAILNDPTIGVRNGNEESIGLGFIVGLKAYDSAGNFIDSGVFDSAFLNRESYVRYGTSLVIPDGTTTLKTFIESHSDYSINPRWNESIFVDNFHLSIVPEPSTYAAIIGALALAGVVFMRRRRA